MSITFPATTFASPANCGHWQMTFDVTVSGTTRTITERVLRQDLTDPDPGDSPRDLVAFVAIIEARRIAKLAGASTRAQVNAALANQTVVI